MAKNNNIRRLNDKRNAGNKSGRVLISTFAVWVCLLLEMMCLAHNCMCISIAVSFGTCWVGQSRMRPGQFSASVQQNG
ncbi:hypothetical protein CEE79_11265, partial [Lactobacillus crispatus]|uniref:hypothetical protein n=1 Tax=Lactobacillus crispatus TaxID=47770 RepID=UPI0010D25536